MTREEAHFLLGLYVGAAADQVEAKYRARRALLEGQLASATGDTSRNLNFSLQQLETARRIALSPADTGPQSSAGTGSGAIPPTLVAMPPTQVVIPPTQTVPALPAQPPGRRRRGPLVLAVLVLLLGIFAATGLLLMRRDPGEVRTNSPENTAKQEAEDALAAWQAYRKAAGIDETAAGGEAAQAMEKARSLAADRKRKEAEDESRRVWRKVLEAFQEEDRRQRELWEKGVLKNWQDRMAGRFPFDPTAAEEAPPAEVEAMLHPRTGALWNWRRRNTALRDVKFGDFRAFEPEGVQRSLEAAAMLRDALYPNGAEAIEVRGHARLATGRAYGYGELVVAGLPVGADTPGFAPLAWKPGQGASLGLWATRRGEDKIPQMDHTRSAWGLLRLLFAGHMTAGKDNVFQWSFEPVLFTRLPGNREPRRTPPADAPTILVQLRQPAHPLDPALWQSVQFQ